jgi:hypothetical protein
VPMTLLTLPDTQQSTGETGTAKLNGATFTTNMNVDPQAENATWKLEAEDIDALRKNVRDILMVFHYSISSVVGSGSPPSA